LAERNARPFFFAAAAFGRALARCGTVRRVTGFPAVWALAARNLRKRHMTKMKLLAASTAIAALMAMPVAALTVTVDSELSTDLTALGADATVATEVTSDVAPDAGSEAAAAFVGDVVVSSDGVTVGVVESATTEAGAQTKLVIALDGSVDTKAEKFALTIDAAAVSDTEILLPWTKAELVSALDSKTMTEADNG
jgi:hypothetical protein